MCHVRNERSDSTDAEPYLRVSKYSAGIEKLCEPAYQLVATLVRPGDSLPGNRASRAFARGRIAGFENKFVAADSAAARLQLLQVEPALAEEVEDVFRLRDLEGIPAEPIDPV